MKRYLLDTNIVSYVIQNRDQSLNAKLKNTHPNQICISSITEAELRYGLAKKPEARQLKLLVNEFLVRVDILSWESNVAEHYALLRMLTESKGISLGAHDMLIAAHAKAVNAILITNDKAFFKLKPFLAIEDWTKEDSK